MVWEMGRPTPNGGAWNGIKKIDSCLKIILTLTVYNDIIYTEYILSLYTTL